MLAELRPLFALLIASLPIIAHAQCPSSLNNTNGFGTLTLFFEDSSTPDDLVSIDVDFPTIDGNFAVTQPSNDVYQTFSNIFGGEILSGEVMLNYMDGSTEICQYEEGLFFDPLPVELADFKGSLLGEDVHLSWQTLSESENAGFEIERSFDGERFEIIGMEIGAGTSSVAQAYYFEDYGARSQALGKEVYYRLVQIDYDGKKTYSEVLTVDLNLEFEKFEITRITGWDADAPILKVYYYAPIVVRKLNFVLSDRHGRVIHRKSLYPEQGLNFFEVDLSRDQSNFYFFVIDNGQELISKKVALGMRF